MSSITIRMPLFQSPGDLFQRPTAFFILVSPMILAYDILLTFPEEVNCIWRRKISAVTILYGVIRYGTLLQLAIQLLVAFWAPDTIAVCSFILSAPLVVNILEMISIAIFSFLRVWAVTGFKFYYGLPFFVLLTGLVLPSVYLYSYFLFSPSYVFDESGCYIKISGDVKMNMLDLKIVAYSPWISSIVTDLLVVGITWQKMKGIPHIARFGRGITSSLTSIFIRHGNIYFCVIPALNIPFLIFGPSFSDMNFGNGGSGLLYLQHSLTAILISRFILELRLVGSPPSVGNYSSSSFINFASQIVGDIGAPLENARGTQRTHIDEDIAGPQVGELETLIQ